MAHAQHAMQQQCASFSSAAPIEGLPPSGESDPSPRDTWEQYSEEDIEQIRSAIFGTHIGNGLRSGRKVLRRKLLGEKIKNYYTYEPITGKQDPLWEDLDMERQKGKLDKLKRRGKAPPKKGQGKRAGKKK